jgi:adenine-specific DNA-methyltransferase
LRALRRRKATLSVLTEPSIGDGYSIYFAPASAADKSWAPRPYRPLMLLENLTRAAVPAVEDVFHVRQGARTGNNSIFLLSKEKWAALPAGERTYFRKAVVNSSIRSGRLLDTTYVFFPYGNHEILNEASLVSNVATYFDRILKPNETKLRNRAGINPDRWWELTRHRSWQLHSKPKIVSAYFGDRGSFTWDDLGEYVIVQGFGWLPRKQTMTVDPRIGYAYLSVLNSAIFSDLLSATSNNVGGGQWDLSPRFINNVRLPDITDSVFSQDLVRTLADFGMRIAKVGLGGLSESESATYEEAVRAAYGVTQFG